VTTAPVTPVIVSSKERRSQVVQAVGRRPEDVERRWWESLLVFALFTAAYAWFGYWLVVEKHVVGFETLDRLNRAVMIWHNQPPKLSAIGFDYPPLTTLAVAPLALFRGLASSLTIVPLASAVYGALTMVALNTLMRRASIVAPLRVAVLVALGLNPLVVLYAASGARHFIWISLLVIAVGALCAWFMTADVRFVMISGLAFSLAALAGYSSLLWFALAAMMIGGILARLGADGTEVEGTVVGFAAPTVYVVALWTAFNLLILRDPFNWITQSSDAPGTGNIQQFDVAELATATGELVLYAAPLAIVVLPALIFSGFSRSNPMALWLGVLLLASILSPPVAVLLNLTDDPMLMRNGLPILVLSVIGAIWLARTSDSGNALVAGGLVVALLASIPWTFNAMKTYEYQNLESVFANAVSTRDSQEGATTLDGDGKVGIVSEQAMAAYIRRNIDDENSILTDNAQTYAVMLMTGRPDLFFDRVDKSDGPWQQAAKDPAEHVDYMLLSVDTTDDLLSRLYVEAADGSDALLPVAFRTERYVLVNVPTGYNRGSNSLEQPPTEEGQQP
jgi:hypothetical protein